MDVILITLSTWFCLTPYSYCWSSPCMKILSSIVKSNLKLYISIEMMKMLKELLTRCVDPTIPRHVWNNRLCIVYQQAKNTMITPMGVGVPWSRGRASRRPGFEFRLFWFVDSEEQLRTENHSIFTMKDNSTRTRT